MKIFNGVTALGLSLLFVSGCGGRDGDGGKAPAASPYLAASSALKLDDAQMKSLQGLSFRPASVLAADEDLGRILESGAAALDLFRTAAAAPGDGYMFSPKREKPALPELDPVYGRSLSAFRLLLVQGKIAAAQGRRPEAERDLLAAAGYMVHLAEQESDRTLATLFLVQAMKDSFPVISESLQGDNPSPAYTEGVAAAFSRIYARLDLMRGGLMEDGEAFKNNARDALSPERLNAALKEYPFHKRLITKFLQNGDYRSAVEERYSSAIDARVKACLEAFAANSPAAAREFIDAQRDELAAAAKAEYPRSLAGIRARMAAETVVMLAGNAMTNYPDMIRRYHGLYAAAGIMRTGLAVKAYRKTHPNRRALPEPVALVPAFLDRLPGDPDNNFAPFKISKAGDGFAVLGRRGVPIFIDYSKDRFGKGVLKRSKLKGVAAGN